MSVRWLDVITLAGLASIIFAMGLLVGMWFELGHQIKQLKKGDRS